MKEYTQLLGKNRSLVGIVTDNETFNPHQKRKIGAVLLNAGLIHHIGPNRIYVRIAREVAALGIVALRFDLSGIGDSLPRSDSLPREEAAIEEICEVIDYLQHVKGVDDVILITACASTPLAFLVAESDTRVIGCILINPMAPTSPNLTYQMTNTRYYWTQAVFSKASWLKLIKLQASFKHIWKATQFLIVDKIFSKHHTTKPETAPIVERMNNILDLFRERDLKILAVSSENEFGIQIMKKMLGEKYYEIERSGILETEYLPRTDHNVTPINSQNKLLTYIVNWIKVLQQNR